ncbi:MAG TPA: hypothetical protein VJB35_00980 [Candidatus Nanoarchaeia archaeon]|nr:hypothetical protein [Candidatus Nanoarchaeia archaeon]
MVNLITILGFILFTSISGMLFISYIYIYRDREEICNATTVNRILQILQIKHQYRRKIEKIIDEIYSPVRKDKNFLLAWFLNNLEFSDKRIKD